MAEELTRIVSLTVTEGGYSLDGRGELMTDDANIVAELDAYQSNRHPTTAIGYLVWALSRRWRSNRRPFTVLSCDNIPHNGDRARAAVLQFAHLVDAPLAKWVARERHFPNSMVDCITPATTDELRRHVRCDTAYLLSQK